MSAPKTGNGKRRIEKKEKKDYCHFVFPFPESLPMACAADVSTCPCSVSRYVCALADASGLLRRHSDEQDSKTAIHQSFSKE